MHRISRSVCSGLVVAACLSSAAGAAHAQEASPTVLSADQVSAAFASAGYQVDHATAWDWTSPSVTSIEVHDTRTGRVIMALVYPTLTAAATGRLEAETHDRTSQAGADGVGPHMIAGYGPSVWNGNVALVETTETDIQHAYQAQIDRDNGLNLDVAAVYEPALPGLAVDSDFQLALQTGPVNL